MWKQPGEKAANRAGARRLGRICQLPCAESEYGRPLFIACSADLADSTNVGGFAAGFGDLPGWGWYERDDNPTGALLPAEITEFTNAGIDRRTGQRQPGRGSLHTTSTASGAACSTYGSFSYLKYGEMRLFSQLAQDCELRVGKVLWVAGHSGPETAEDSRTHFGIFAPGVTQLFPDGQVIDLHPWEYNEVPVVLGAALATGRADRRPAPDPAGDRDPGPGGAGHPVPLRRRPRRLRPATVPRRPASSGGTVFIRGTMPTHNLVTVAPRARPAGLNVKVVAAISPQLFACRTTTYREAVARAGGPRSTRW